ncbi:MAG TPA: ATP-binding protein [Pseudonocardiaceae bacterium]|nr:ATP-binding protein [Pseudonocardiaceae bacterium]
MDRLLLGDQLDLVALPTAVSCARLFTRYTLSNWRASFVMADALVVVEELVCLAVQQTGVTDPATRWTELPALNLLTVRLLGYEGRIRVEVWDSTGEPAALPDTETYENLTGLHLVDVTAHDWGSSVQPRGRVTWADLLVYPHTESGLPIRRRRRTVPAEPAELVDEGLLRRVRDGLDGLKGP